MRVRIGSILGAGLLTLAGTTFAAELPAAPGDNPQPVHLRRPNSVPLSAMAQLGNFIFYDTTLSSSGQMSCASCHSPEHHYGPPNSGAVMLGGPNMTLQGARAVPSLAYLERQPNFSIGVEDPTAEANENLSAAQNIAQLATAAKSKTLLQKTATDTAQAAANMVPQGGLFWDGRAETLQDQATFPLLAANEMDGGSIETVANKLKRAPYSDRFVALFGARIFANPSLLISEAMFAVARYQIEEPSFHPYTSKFDYWLEGKAQLNAAELNGYRLFNDPMKANCGGCHLDKPSPDGLPPLFTDHEFEALGAPRNLALVLNKDPNYYDLGLCGPIRTDLTDQKQYCGMFATPTLRNVTTRRVFFHNGVFTSLQQVLDFYNFRDTNPEKVYPRAADGAVQKYNDIPEQHRVNVDVADPPFNRRLGDVPAMTAQEEADIIAFLGTLTDGYKPATTSH